ncbi:MULTISPECIES: hypothetical protein [Dyadobacter]|uniref:DUF998 domain-containing protein n=1 Tax=Dyadobacter psychrotolerans TaxID=2541721 RepID=A0A4R5DMB5_9BACT|nr:hypothetical protein [Dyadobacter psychrotolerans]TDE13234.1 hypothetical protein E0F88_19480 [Dyadobacter psychrotolerans]
MHKSFTKVSGVSLCFGSLISVITMVLHPAGGSVEHIIRIQHVLIFSHALGIACLPFMGFGAWSLSCLLQTDSKISLLSLFVFCLGLVAAMIAAAVNGLILPQFLSDLTARPVDKSIVNSIVRYGHHINVSMANIFISATCISILIWCLLIIQTQRLPKAAGYLGLSLLGFGLICILSKANFTDLYGFRIFVAGLATWLTTTGIRMIMKGKSENKYAGSEAPNL